MIFTKDFTKIIRDKSSIRNETKNYKQKFEHINTVINLNKNNLNPLVKAGLFEYLNSDLKEIDNKINNDLFNQSLKNAINEKLKKIQGAIEKNFKSKNKLTKKRN